MSFVKLSIFGTSFEVTTRYVDLQPVGMGAFGLVCSAKDQLMGTSVAIKKIMKPFSTPVLSKRTYRELKLLKHIQHENVCTLSTSSIPLSMHKPLCASYHVTPDEASRRLGYCPITILPPCSANPMSSDKSAHVDYRPLRRVHFPTGRYLLCHGTARN